MMRSLKWFPHVSKLTTLPYSYTYCNMKEIPHCKDRHNIELKVWGSCLIYIICGFVLPIVVSNTYCVVALLCLSSSFVLCMVVSNTYYVVALLCLSSSFVLCMVVPKTYCVVALLCLSSSCVLCMVVSNTYCVVCFLYLCPVSWVPNAASICGLSVLIVPSVFSNVYLKCWSWPSFMGWNLLP